MTDRVYPSAKPNATATATATAFPPLKPPPTKTHLYNPNRHPFRPNPNTRHRQKNHRKHNCRRCCCLTCFWSILLLILILLLAAIAGAAVYVLYHPQRPTFSVTSLKISSFNLTAAAPDDTAHLTAKLNLTLSAKNPNKKMVFFYDPISIIVQSNSVNLSNGTFTNFTSSPGSVFVIHTVIGTNSQLLYNDDVNSLNSGLKRKTGLPMKIVVDTMVGVKLEKLKMKKVGIRVNCDEIHGLVPKGKDVTPAVANVSKANCKVDLRIKIWKWNILI
ncbi:hypothetical protein ACJIZ3_001643 [Penstemon smallii]|uniref:Late embryogenesis abundant protein LEA-2 subgroup domain-containing protein n=1 Tax=Penstemon smallii TaxID=265156 RepID=A0ABD3U728_9LAMI